MIIMLMIINQFKSNLLWVKDAKLSKTKKVPVLKEFFGNEKKKNLEQGNNF